MGGLSVLDWRRAHRVQWGAGPRAWSKPPLRRAYGKERSRIRSGGSGTRDFLISWYSNCVAVDIRRRRPAESGNLLQSRLSCSRGVAFSRRGMITGRSRYADVDKEP